MSKSWISGLKSTAVALAVCAMVTPANAHVIIEGFKGRANYNEFLNLMVPHGCGLLDTTEVYDEVIWRGNLPALHLGVFKFLARITGPIDSVVPFKVIQTCGDKEDRWVDVVDEGEPGWKMWALEAPAPFVVVVEGDGPQLGASMQDIGAERQRLGSATKQ